MRYAFLLAILLAPLASAMQVQTIYYDAHNESGSEFIMLQNVHDETIILDGWRIATSTSESDATLSGSLAPGASYLVADSGWSQGKDNATWPAADHEETLTLPNTAGYVQIIDREGTIHDTVGYGSSETFLGTPHPGTAEGEALMRVTSTDDNAADFIAQAPSFTPGEGTNGSESLLLITIENHAPRILSVEVADDSDAAGIQLAPLPGGERPASINVTLEDNNSLAAVTVTANGAALTTSDNGTVGTYRGTVPILTDTESIHIVADDGTERVEQTIPIELLGVTAIGIPANLTMRLAPGGEAREPLTIENLGTTTVSLQIKGDTPSLQQRLLGGVQYTLLGSTFPLAREFRQHDIALAPGQQAALEMTVSGGFVPPGDYVGRVIIAGVPQ